MAEALVREFDEHVRVMAAAKKARAVMEREGASRRESIDQTVHVEVEAANSMIDAWWCIVGMGIVPREAPVFDFEAQADENNVAIQSPYSVYMKYRDTYLARRSLRRAENLLTPFERPSGTAENDECVVCMESLEKGDLSRVGSCTHVFHTVCILKWINTHATCPVCRARLKYHDTVYKSHTFLYMGPNMHTLHWMIKNWNTDRFKNRQLYLQDCKTEHKVYEAQEIKCFNQVVKMYRQLDTRAVDLDAQRLEPHTSRIQRLFNWLAHYVGC